MALNSSFLQASPDSTGKKINTRTLTDSLGTVVHRQGSFIGDPIDEDKAVQVTSDGALKTDNSHITQPTNEKYSFASISASGTVKSGAGTLGGFLCTSSTSGTVTIYDNTAATGTKIIDTMTVVAGTPYPIPVAFATGCTVVITGAATLTVFYN